MGWSSKAASLELGTDKHGFGYGSTGKKSHARSFDDYGGPFKQVGFRLLAAELQGLGGRGDT